MPAADHHPVVDLPLLPEARIEVPLGQLRLLLWSLYPPLFLLHGPVHLSYHLDGWVHQTEVCRQGSWRQSVPKWAWIGGHSQGKSLLKLLHKIFFALGFDYLYLFLSIYSVIPVFLCLSSQFFVAIALLFFLGSLFWRILSFRNPKKTKEWARVDVLQRPTWLIWGRCPQPLACLTPKVVKLLQWKLSLPTLDRKNLQWYIYKHTPLHIPLLGFFFLFNLVLFPDCTGCFFCNNSIQLAALLQFQLASHFANQQPRQDLRHRRALRGRKFCKYLDLSLYPSLNLNKFLPF